METPATEAADSALLCPQRTRVPLRPGGRVPWSPQGPPCLRALPHPGLLRLLQTGVSLGAGARCSGDDLPLVGTQPSRVGCGFPERLSPVPTPAPTPQGPTLTFLLQTRSPVSSSGAWDRLQAHRLPQSPPAPRLLWGPKVCGGSTPPVTLHGSSGLVDASVSPGGQRRKSCPCSSQPRKTHTAAEKGARGWRREPETLPEGRGGTRQPGVGPRAVQEDRMTRRRTRGRSFQGGGFP